jgi:hypothetical protein
LTHDAVKSWIDAYVNAWRTYDPAAIGDLFAEDATYAYHPYDEGEEVVRAARPSSPTGWRSRTNPALGRRATVPWWSRGSGQ